MDTNLFGKSYETLLCFINFMITHEDNICPISQKFLIGRSKLFLGIKISTSSGWGLKDTAVEVSGIGWVRLRTK